MVVLLCSRMSLLVMGVVVVGNVIVVVDIATYLVSNDLDVLCFILCCCTFSLHLVVIGFLYSLCDLFYFIGLVYISFSCFCDWLLKWSSM